MLSVFSNKAIIHIFNVIELERSIYNSYRSQFQNRVWDIIHWFRYLINSKFANFPPSKIQTFYVRKL